jgi:Flp pilus assembly pilin Flp
VSDVGLPDPNSIRRKASAEDNVATKHALAGDDRGQGLAEYGLILGFIAILCIVAVLFLSGNIQGLLSNAGSSI